jgi:hypothetical protein
MRPHDQRPLRVVESREVQAETCRSDLILGDRYSQSRKIG